MLGRATTAGSELVTLQVFTDNIANTIIQYITQE